MNRPPKPLRVLESVGAIKPTTNPYLAQLIAALRRRSDVEVELFSFPRAIFGRYDVFHVHWPEVTFGGHRPIGRLVRRTLTTVLLTRLRLTRTPIVRTWHNTERPQGLSRWDHRLLDGFDRRTTVVIRLNDATDPSLAVPVHTVPLGHYRDWFERLPRAERARGRIAYVGLIRRYKGVEDLVSAFRDVRTPGASLAVSGRASTSELQERIRSLAGDDPRISLRFAFIEEAELVEELTASSLVALPFVHMHNSSTVLAALSLDRPVLVPDNEVNRLLSAEVGEGWIHMYRGALTGAAIDEALARVATPPPGRPRLDARGWDDAARQHVDAFRAARDRTAEPTSAQRHAEAT